MWQAMCSEDWSREPWHSSLVRRLNAFQYALSTRSGTECIAHAIQGLTDLDEAATVVSIDGIGAFDVVSRRAMLEGLQTVEGGDSAMPFVLQSYLWEDQEGAVHTIVQAEGGEQGNPLMPALFSLGQHPALPGCAVPIARWRTSFRVSR